MCMRCCIRVIKDLRNSWDSRARFHTCVVYRDTLCRNYLTAIYLCNTGSCAQSFACERRHTTDQHSHEKKRRTSVQICHAECGFKGTGCWTNTSNVVSLKEAQIHDRVSATTWSIQEYVCVCTQMNIKMMMTFAKSHCVPLDMVHCISYINCLEREVQQMQTSPPKIFQSLVQIVPKS